MFIAQWLYFIGCWWVFSHLCLSSDCYFYSLTLYWMQRSVLRGDVFIHTCVCDITATSPLICHFLSGSSLFQWKDIVCFVPKKMSSILSPSQFPLSFRRRISLTLQNDVKCPDGGKLIMVRNFHWLWHHVKTHNER